jgi:farnesyl-diphosphate farnesyltransferase
VNPDLGNAVLRDVSRSFYLTLRLLPKPMRDGASLGYLLARTSDTLADAASAPVDVRFHFLSLFAQAVAGEAVPPRWPVSLLNSIPNKKERRLLEGCGEILDWLKCLPETEARLVREVVATIISGQTLDLERFGRADRDNVVILSDDGALEDYAWRVAGCVGAFWTRLGFLTMRDRFSRMPEESLLEKGIAYGKGLQLVNILRDLTDDLDAGRCYIPVENPHDTGELLATHRHWCERAEGWISSGVEYAAMLNSRRLRAATVLPARIARKSLLALKLATWETLQTRVKVPRSAVYRMVFQAFFQATSPRSGSED